MNHIAIVTQQQAQAILTGRRHVEPRLSRTRIAPFGRIHPGEEICFADPAGRPIALAHVAGVMSFEDLRPADVRTLARRYAPMADESPAAWESAVESRFATLIWLGGVAPAPIHAHAVTLSRTAWRTVAPRRAQRRSA